MDYWGFFFIFSSSNGRLFIFPPEYWLFCRGPGFLAVVWFGSSPSLSSVSKLDRRHTGSLRKRDNLLTREGEGGSQIIRWRASLVLYKSFNTLCCIPLYVQRESVLIKAVEQLKMNHEGCSNTLSEKCTHFHREFGKVDYSILCTYLNAFLQSN